MRWRDLPDSLCICIRDRSRSLPPETNLRGDLGRLRTGLDDPSTLSKSAFPTRVENMRTVCTRSLFNVVRYRRTDLENSIAFNREP